eukprot:CAMPEP_0117431656 /NCGR_PEP_ID=MMETSP0758-20121206/11190_1 /TAXON_ID=63605 /ORGANISM="Percolomonas cosmopolitus, Strain AE-1 (ATCC 50343)" /LENGTH=151 /DNA_ID=CAMNT_0005220883 /DNA_START=592 /DNA_END=1047 /DNA_ORIENTATION=+
MIDMQWLIDERREEYDETTKASRRLIKQAWEKNPHESHRLALINATKGNINLTMYHESALRALFFKEKTNLLNSDHLNNMKQDIQERAEKAALTYATFLQTINTMDLVLESIPGAIRLTCHVKPGQIGMHMIQDLEWSRSDDKKGNNKSHV